MVALSGLNNEKRHRRRCGGVRHGGPAATSLATFSSAHDVRKTRTKATAGAKMARTLASMCPIGAAQFPANPKEGGPPEEEILAAPNPVTLTVVRYVTFPTRYNYTTHSGLLQWD